MSPMERPLSASVLLSGIALAVLAGCTGGDPADTAASRPSRSVSALDEESASTCRRAGASVSPSYARQVSLVGAYSATVGEIDSWIQRKRSAVATESVWVTDGRLAVLPPADRLSLCYFDGTVRHAFGSDQPPGADRFVLAVSKVGTTYLLAGTLRSAIPLERPGP